MNAKIPVVGMLALMGYLFAGPAFSSNAPSPTDAQLQPSGEGVPFNPGQYQNFDDYIRQTRERLLRHKVYMDPNQKQLELAASVPFERMPAAACESMGGTHRSRGIVLLHGLADMPVAMTDLAEAFAARCFLVRVLLLPGHGTRAGDLLEVTRSDWLAATRFGLETLKMDVDEVYVGGFSLGGLLAIHALLSDASLKGAFIFSPALLLDSAGWIRQAVWLRHLFKWADQDPQDDYARYEAMPMNALAETFLLSRELARLLEQNEVAVPVFIAHSADDPVIDVGRQSRLLPRAIHSSGKPPGRVSSLFPGRDRPQRFADPLRQQFSARATDRQFFTPVDPYRTDPHALRHGWRLSKLWSELG